MHQKNAQTKNCINGIYLIIGGNMGDRISYLEASKRLLADELGQIIKQSAVYETAAWGKEDESPFLNQVCYFESAYTPFEILEICLRTEKQLGRTRDRKWEARIIDIDILLIDAQIIHQNNLTVPHPHLHQRRFVLVPIAEIAPHVIHPLLHRTMSELLKDCPDPLEVKLFVP